jgi:3-isopropylmalate dehydrogenase
MKRIIAVLPGDGIGEEVVAQALRVLEVVAKKFQLEFETTKALIGGAAFEVYGNHFPTETMEVCKNSAAILFGSVGGPVSQMNLDKWKNCETNSLLGLRKAFGFNCNYRPVKIFPALASFCPLKPEIVGAGIDILFIRELIGDLYFGEKKRFEENGLRVATDVARYDEEQISSVAHLAFQAAQKRRKKVTSVDKANVLMSSKLWREVTHEVAKNYPEITLEDMLVDNCAMQIIKNPRQFDVILTSNLFGDILSDAGAVLPGSLGLMASASINNKDGFGMFEPPGGSAQDIAGKGIANPIGQILSLAMLLRFSFNLESAALAIEQAVDKSLADGYRTGDISEKTTRPCSTVEMADAIIERI